MLNRFWDAWRDEHRTPPPWNWGTLREALAQFFKQQRDEAEIECVVRKIVERRGETLEWITPTEYDLVRKRIGVPDGAWTYYRWAQTLPYESGRGLRWSIERWIEIWSDARDPSLDRAESKRIIAGAQAALRKLRKEDELADAEEINW